MLFSDCDMSDSLSNRQQAVGHLFKFKLFMSKYPKLGSIYSILPRPLFDPTTDRMSAVDGQRKSIPKRQAVKETDEKRKVDRIKNFTQSANKVHEIKGLRPNRFITSILPLVGVFRI